MANPKNDRREIDAPEPTLVGPRAGSDAAGKVSVPEGIERLLALAGVSSEWRDKILRDPIASAAEAGIDLSHNEANILRTIPRASLAGIADSFARKHRPSRAGKLVAGAAAAAALAATLLPLSGESVAVAADVVRDPPPAGEGGIRADSPQAAPQVAWFDTLDGALALAAKSNRAVMAIVLHPSPVTGREPMVPMAGVPARVIGPQEASQKVCQTDSKEFRLAVRDAALLAVRVTKPVFTLSGKETPVEVAQAQERHADATEKYDALLKKYEIGDKLPAVIFLAPDGSALSQITRPADEAKLLDAIKAVPPLLAAWLAKHPPANPPPASKGIRPDVPREQAGVRPDVP